MSISRPVPKLYLFGTFGDTCAKIRNIIFLFFFFFFLREIQETFIYSSAFVGFESNRLSIADSRETESAGGPNVPRVPRGAALSHHTRTDINTWPPRYLQSVDSLSSINYGGKTSATRCALRFAFYSTADSFSARCLWQTPQFPRPHKASLIWRWNAW